MPDLAIAILAAGVSARMGKPKQLLEYKGQSLLQRAVAVAQSTGCTPVFLVTNGLHTPPDIDTSVITVVNSQYSGGISSSIRIAIEQAALFPGISGLLIMNCDQPHLDARCLKLLVQAFRPGAIVASSFDGILGSPAVFDKCFFAELLHLSGDTGAKSVIKKNADCVIACAMTGAQFDVDTPADYEILLQS